ncbi:MAG TPA: UDP-glucose/GDP-mannose dehydrogenase family protein [Candidatus Dormibacteraeota bacterium]|nr:UDP-glucose/GDP-mannose dehydrogenase family protein [Candidatus Dormibacteraeota bacterium]
MGTADPARVAVVGCGHVGLVMAAGLAELGHDVHGIDRDEGLVEALQAGVVRLEEPDLPELVQKGVASGHLCFTSSYPKAIEAAQFVFLAVDTPQTLAGAADLRNIRSATRSIANALNGVNPIIINKSTSPIGTGETIESILELALERKHHLPRIAANPEFLRQGRAVHDFFNPDRIVVGARVEDDARSVANLYAGLPGEVILTDLRTAEMIKYVANSFLATRISFINEIARLCEQIGVDVERVVEGISLDPRVGRHFFHPGIGYGGSCLPKDVAALRYIGETFGVATPVLSAVQEVNTAQRTGAVRRLRARLGTLEGKAIGVWGLTFKAGTEDTRESPAMDVVGLLRNEGAHVQLFDPSVSDHAERLPENLRTHLRTTPLEAAIGADALAILTDWPQFCDVPLHEVRGVMRGNVVFDGRNLLSRDAVEAAGLAYIGVGRTATAHRRRRTD